MEGAIAELKQARDLFKAQGQIQMPVMIHWLLQKINAQ
jgi:hypothetical protein